MPLKLGGGDDKDEDDEEEIQLLTTVEINFNEASVSEYGTYQMHMCKESEVIT